jgi:hypothetical protein
MNTGVHSLEAFGSILRDDFLAGRSDVDILVEFEAQAADSFSKLSGPKKVAGGVYSNARWIWWSCERSATAGCAITSSSANHRSMSQRDPGVHLDDIEYCAAAAFQPSKGQPFHSANASNAASGSSPAYSLLANARRRS